MKKIFLFILNIGIFVLPLMAATPENSLLNVENMVDKMYGDLKAISNTSTNKVKVSSLKIDFPAKYFTSKDQDSPNEFNYIGYNNQYNRDIQARRYVVEFYEMFRDRNFAGLSFDFKRKNGNLLKEPEFKKGETSPNLVQIIVQKVYSRNGSPLRILEDTLIISVQKMKVQKWTNKTSINYIGDYEIEAILDIEQMEMNAALAYNSGQYDKAYQIYQSIIKQYPTEGNPYYRMAVMLYKKEYDLNVKKKERERLILEYLDKAIKHGSFSISKCADNMKYWITC